MILKHIHDECKSCEYLMAWSFRMNNEHSYCCRRFPTKYIRQDLHKEPCPEYRKKEGGQSLTYQEQIKAIEDYMDASLGVNGEITKRAEEVVKEMKAASGDLISRQAAIDEIGEKSDEIYKTKMKGATFPHDDFFQAMAYAETIVKNLPSAQPDHIAEVSKKGYSARLSDTNVGNIRQAGIHSRRCP